MTSFIRITSNSEGKKASVISFDCRTDYNKDVSLSAVDGFMVIPLNRIFKYFPLLLQHFSNMILSDRFVYHKCVLA